MSQPDPAEVEQCEALSLVAGPLVASGVSLKCSTLADA